MKNLISRFSDKLLSKEVLQTVKGGTDYCNCGTGSGPINIPTGCDCEGACNNTCGGGSAFGGHTLNTTYYKTTQPGNGWGGTNYK